MCKSQASLRLSFSLHRAHRPPEEGGQSQDGGVRLHGVSLRGERQGTWGVWGQGSKWAPRGAGRALRCSGSRGAESSAAVTGGHGRNAWGGGGGGARMEAGCSS